jgi:hypothetical protein
MDLTAGIFWAATAPHQLGRFVAFDVTDPEKLLPDQAIPEDPLLADGTYGRFQQAKALVEQGWSAYKQRDFATAEALARGGETNNPGFYANQWLLAEALFAEGRTNEAAAACQSALAGLPALASERRKLDKLARALGVAGDPASLSKAAAN